jgi:hypothetical protein
MTTPPRPHKTDDDIMATVAKRLLSEVVDWMGGSDRVDEDDEEDEEDDILKDLTETLQDSVELDGRKLAKKLEDDHLWFKEADSDLVDIMGQADRIAYALAKEKVEAWIVTNNITPTFTVEDHVTWEHGWGNNRSGTIVAIRPGEARYTIQEDGKTYPDKNAGGWIVDYEEVREFTTNGANA